MTGLGTERALDEQQTELNFQRWEEIHDDPQWDAWVGRIETDRLGNVLMSPPAGVDHADYSRTIFLLLESLLKGGRALIDCPVSTAAGMRVPDVLWVSSERRRKTYRPLGLTAAPEICVEVLSPRNRRKEMDEKKALFFSAGAAEVWYCDGKGRMTFFTRSDDAGQERSAFWPAFPARVEQE